MLSRLSFISESGNIPTSYAIWYSGFFFRLNPKPIIISRFLKLLSYFKKSLSLTFQFLHLNTKSLGVKFFLTKGYFFIDLGYSHYCVIRIPNQLLVYARKKNLYAVSFFSSAINTFSYLIWRLKRFSVYKNKGLLPSSRVKYLKLKLGKKQQI